MQDDWQPESSQLGGAVVSAAIAFLIHAFVLVMLLAAVLCVLGITAFYEEWELSRDEGVMTVLGVARMVQYGWFLLILPMLADAAFVIWLALKPSRRWMLTWLNYLWLGAGLMSVTVAFALLVKPLVTLIPQ